MFKPVLVQGQLGLSSVKGFWSMCQRIPKVRILVIATNEWPSTGQLVAALIKVGFEIAVVCPLASPIRLIRNLDARYEYRSSRSLSSIKSAITGWSPFLLVCNDDVAIRELHTIHRQAIVEIDRPESPGLVRLIELSLGDHRAFAASRSKSRLFSIAEALNILCPSTIVVNSCHDIDRQPGLATYPVLIKLDELWGGLGIRLVKNSA